jgi:integrase
MPKLTADTLAKIAPDPLRRLELRDTGPVAVAGLIFRITPAGARSWSVRYLTEAGDHRRKSLGTYPEIGLARARVLARIVHGQTAEKVDVVGEEREAKAEAQRQRLNRLDTLADAYFAAAAIGSHRSGHRVRPKAPRSLAEEQRTWRVDLKPTFGKRPVTAITRREVIAFIDGLTQRSPGAGRHAYTLLRQLMSFALARDLIEHNPLLGLAVVQPQPRTRQATHAELQAIWPALCRPGSIGSKIAQETALLLRMLVVTPLRVSELAGLRWSEVDRDAGLLRLPAARMKGKREHLAPLNRMALDILAEAEELNGPEGFVFPSPQSGLPMASDTVGQAWERVMDALGIADLNPHDCRRTMTTRLTASGIPRELVGRLLAHAEAGGVTGRHYDIHDYLPEKRAAGERWSSLLAAVINGEANSMVVAFPAAGQAA